MSHRSGRFRGITEIFNRLDDVPDHLRNSIFRESVIWLPIDKDDPVEQPACFFTEQNLR